MGVKAALTELIRIGKDCSTEEAAVTSDPVYKGRFATGVFE
jgi:hypothetical protein